MPLTHNGSLHPKHMASFGRLEEGSFRFSGDSWVFGNFGVHRLVLPNGTTATTLRGASDRAVSGLLEWVLCPCCVHLPRSSSDDLAAVCTPVGAASPL